MANTQPSPDNPPAVSNKAAAIEELRPVYALVEEDFRAVNALIPSKLTSDVDLVEEISRYIVDSGGKRLRPLMVLLVSRALNYEGDKHLQLAAIIEFLHTATLLHDDVVDHSGMRRGRLTANEKWGNAPSVLVGDFLYSRAFQLMVEVGSMDIMAVLSAATNTIAEGEVMQLANVGNLAISETQYREVIRCKTALLFEAATHTGALLAAAGQHCSAAEVNAARRFGCHFGLTFQLVDDWLDYTSDAATMGKNAGDDLAEGKLTLPLIYALEHASAADAEFIRAAVSAKSAENLAQILTIVRSCGALEYTHQAAVAEVEKALTCIDALPPGPYVEALRTVTHYSTARLF
ncbi:MAG: polyprenyl synthetase family protein [Pseudomonadota bacterium]